MGAPRAGSLVLPALVFLLPFEPRRPVLHLLGFQVTVLEAAAGALGAALLWSVRRRVPALLRRPPLPLALLALYAAAHLLSVVFAPAHRDLAAKFALRMVAMAGLGLAVAAAPPEARRRALVALVAPRWRWRSWPRAEGAGLRGLDPFLGPFREMPFNIGGSRRASGGLGVPQPRGRVPDGGDARGVRAWPPGGAGRRRRSCPWPSSSRWRSCSPTRAARSWPPASRWRRWRRRAGGDAGRARAGGPGRPARRFAPASPWSGEVYRLRLGAEGAGLLVRRAVRARGERRSRSGPREVRTTSVRVTNTGRMTWTAGGVFHLSYHWYDTGGRKLEDGRRTLLPRDVAPGEAVRAARRAPGATPRKAATSWPGTWSRSTWPGSAARA